MVCLLSHVRRLRREPDKLRQCLQGATGQQRQAIQKLVDLPLACKKAAQSSQGSSPRSLTGACKKAKASTSASAGVAQACKKAKIASAASEAQSSPPGDDDRSEHAEATKASKKRTLQQQVSDVSVDSRGWPSMLQSPKEEKKASRQRGPEESSSFAILEKKRLSYRKELEAAAQAAAQDYVDKCQQASPERRRPASKRPAAKSESPEILKKKPAKRDSKALQVAAKTSGSERRPWSAIRKVMGTNQAYLMGLFGDKWKIIIGCTKKMGTHFSRWSSPGCVGIGKSCYVHR